MDLIGLHTLFDSVQARLPSVAALLVAAPGRFDITGLHRVDPNDACLQILDDPQTPEHIAGPDRRCQPVRSVVCDAERVVLILEWNARHDRPKNLYTGNARGVVGFEDRGFDEISIT